MKNILKILKNVPKGSIANLLCVTVGLAVCVAALIAGSTAFAWFSQNAQVSGGGMSVLLDTDSFEIYVERQTEYDQVYNNIPLYDGIAELKTYLDQSGYSTSRQKTSNNSVGVALELVNELESDDTRYLLPGSRGTLTFYIIPKTDAAASFEFSVSTVGLTTQYDNRGRISAILPYVGEDAAAVNDLLKGHLLFFENRSTDNSGQYVYTGLIGDEAVRFDTADGTPVTKTIDENEFECYKIELYWVWPLTYEEMTDGGKYPATGGGAAVSGLADLIQTYPGRFFVGDPDPLNSIQLNDAYNDGDQKIGDAFDYVAVYLTVAELSESGASDG